MTAQDDVDEDPAPSQAPRDDDPRPDRHLVFGVLALALVMTAIDQNIVSTALKSIQHDLGTTLNWSAWTITIYSLAQIIALPIAGRLSDTYGRKKIFIAAVILFTCASVLCGLSTNIYMLITLRALQAAGGGAFLPAAIGVVSEYYGRDRDRAIAMLTSTFPIGVISGPIVGGVLVSVVSWRLIFLINVPVGLFVIYFSLRMLSPSKPKPGSALDMRGIVLFAALIFSAMFGITFLGTPGSSLLAPQFVISESIAVVVLVLFVRHNRRSIVPLIPGRLLFGRGFGAMTLINFIFGVAAMGFTALVPVYAEERYGISPFDAGTLLSARGAGVAVLSMIAVMLLRRTGVRLPMIVGFLLVSVGLFLIHLEPPVFSDYAWLAIAAGFTGVGLGIAVPASNNATLHLALDHISALVGLRGMLRQTGSIMTVSFSTAIAARSDHPGETLGMIFLAYAVIILAIVPLIIGVPEQRGRWLTEPD